MILQTHERQQHDTGTHHAMMPVLADYAMFIFHFSTEWYACLFTWGLPKITLMTTTKKEMQAVT